MKFGKSNWKTYLQGIQKEWLVTNGLGSYACSTIIGSNTRRYHGLLIASSNPPVERHMTVSKIDETLSLGGAEYHLSAFEAGGVVQEGYRHLEEFSYHYLPTYIYRVRDVYIEKTIGMVYGENKTVILYRILGGDSSSSFKLAPLVNFRDYHHTSKANYMNFKSEFNNKTLSITPYELDTKIRLYFSEGVYKSSLNDYFYNMEYAYERERGLDCSEDHYIPGYLTINVKPYEDKYVTVVISLDEQIEQADGRELINNEIARQKRLLDTSGYHKGVLQKLVLAADKFIVFRKSTGAKSVIAGYPWFTDWGRDTMIALPGLTLSTGRYEDAKEILYTFSKYIKDGLVPNVFPDGDSEPAYNTVDAPLWYFEASYQYYKYTNDSEFIIEVLYPVLKEICESYIKGTRYSIGMDSDFLISAGDENTQLTWMDAKVDDWVVTPRHGKAVEINALWYNAVKIISEFALLAGEQNTLYESMSENIKASFFKAFWNETKRCLFDVVGNGFKDSKTRPNQIFAVSLSFEVLEKQYAQEVVKVVWQELYTALGLKSLSDIHEQYRGFYGGDRYARDGAYHQGTVWTWPLGHFIIAFVKVMDNEIIKNVLPRFFEPFKDHLKDGCIGSISEIFDGDEPLAPKGCFAQAWSVSEVLRAYVASMEVEDVIFSNG